MEQGNPNKVNAIVDEIVKNNSVFKLKSPIEQDKEKDSMARSINSALSVLNEVGKELVLQDLSVDPDEKFKGFIDSVGNIDISGLTKMAATIVKAKIEEAEREGLNLRTGEPVFKNDNKISVVEGVLTVAVIDTMIRNYDNLSYEERDSLWDNFYNLSEEQKRAMIENDRKCLNDIIESDTTPQNVKEEAEKLNKNIDKTLEIRQLLNSGKPEDIEKAQGIIKDLLTKREKPKETIENLIKELNKVKKHIEVAEILKTEYANGNNIDKIIEIIMKSAIDNKDFLNFLNDFFNIDYRKETKQLQAKVLLNKDRTGTLSEKDEKELKELLKTLDKTTTEKLKIEIAIDEFKRLTQEINDGKFSQEDAKKIKEKLESLKKEIGIPGFERLAQEISDGKFETEKTENIDESQNRDKIGSTDTPEKVSKSNPEMDEKIAEDFKSAQTQKKYIKQINLPIEQQVSQEIEQLSIALATEGFSQEEISEAMKTYSEFIGGLSGKEDLHIFFDSESPTNEQICLGLKNVFENFKESLEPNSYKILQQLAQNDFGGHLQQILTNPQLLQETFLPALSAEIEKLEQQPIQDEHTDEYYRSQSETLQVDEEFEKIVKEIQAQGGSVKEITVALAKKVEERATEQSQHSIPEEESKEQKTEQPTPPIFENPTSPEEPTQESATSPEQETLEETGQNMAMVKQDNSFIGKIRRVFANMRDMKNKDNSKGFFARLGASIKTVFGNKEEPYEEQIETEEQNNVATTIKTEKPLSFNQQLQQNVKQPIISQPANTVPTKGSHNKEQSDDEIEF